jgi:death-on-curing protein
VSFPDRPLEYLTLEDLLDLARALDVGPVRDVGLLDSAAHRPRSGFMGKDAYTSITDKAAALMHSVCSNHALIDGNKRLALLATAVFLRVNGLDLSLSDDEAFDLTMAVAAGHLTAEGIAAHLRVVPIGDT